MTEKLRTIVDAKVPSDHHLEIRWSDDVDVTLDLSHLLSRPPLAALCDRALFAQVRVGDFGHSVAWPGDIEIGADTLRRLTLLATGKADAVAFLDWRMRHGLSLTEAGEALGLSRRTVAYYSAGDRRVPWTVLLACEGWQARQARDRTTVGYRSASRGDLSACDGRHRRLGRARPYR